MRTIDWDEQKGLVRLIDQRKLPGSLEILECSTVEQVAIAIKQMAIRGAPALGVAGAYGMALAARQSAGDSPKKFHEQLEVAAQGLINTRPTAVNLRWAVEKVMKVAQTFSEANLEVSDQLLITAKKMAEEDVETNLGMAKNGAVLIEDGDTIIHHCNTGALAAVEWGTALGAIRYAHEQGKRVHVLVDETRPRLQGARLTAWECEQYGIPYEIICDSAAGYFLHSGKVHKVFFGADRVAVNGDVVNKVGTYMLSLAAHTNHVPVICVFPTSTFDKKTPDGNSVTIEERPSMEILDIQYQGEQIAPTDAMARNPAFDITPHVLISAWVTEAGVIQPPFEHNFRGCVYNSRLEG